MTLPFMFCGLLEQSLQRLDFLDLRFSSNTCSARASSGALIKPITRTPMSFVCLLAKNLSSEVNGLSHQQSLFSACSDGT